MNIFEGMTPLQIFALYIVPLILGAFGWAVALIARRAAERD